MGNFLSQLCCSCWGNHQMVVAEERAVLNIPEEVLMDILSRLPVKTLLRFRSVSKYWCSLIQNRRFISLHYKNQTKYKNRSTSDYDYDYDCDDDESILVVRSINYSGMVNGKVLMSFQSLYDYDETTTLDPFIDIDLDKYMPCKSYMKHASRAGTFRVYGHCNGIVCITYHGSFHVDIVLCNPATREFKTLPFPSFSYPEGARTYSKCVGFGFDPSCNDFKVIRIMKVFEENREEGYYHPYPDSVEIYNLSTDSWRQIEPAMILPNYIYSNGCSEMFFNGAFHWVGVQGFFHSILAFDMVNEVFRQIHFPNCCAYRNGKVKSVLVLNNSHLALVQYHQLGLGNCFEIWVMNEYGVKESWTKKFTIGPLLAIRHPLAFWKGGNELLLESSGGQLVSCDLDNEEIEEFEVYGIPISLRVLSYTESLFSFKQAVADQ